jgi:hypothetical protein
VILHGTSHRTGNTSVAAAVNNGFVGSGTDGGHGGDNAGSPLYEEPYTSVPLDDPGNTCQPGVVTIGGKNELNVQFINDYFTNAPGQEVIWSKKVASLYYGRKPLYNYWNGCSTGGHQGMDVAQNFAGEVQGILASALAMYWTRFATAQQWGQIAMYDIANEVIAGGKLAAAQKAAITACDGNDGVLDGIIDDPRTCTFNATANVCGQPTAPAAPNCLTTAEAEAVNIMWDGPRNNSGKRIWFPIDRGTDFTAAASLRPTTGSAVATWRRTFPSEPLSRAPRASRCRVTMSLCSTSTRSTASSTMTAAASKSRPASKQTYARRE